MDYTLTLFQDAIEKMEPSRQTTNQKQVARNWTMHYEDFPWVENIIMSLRNDDGTVSISRGEIYTTENPVERLVKTLYWGYPKGFPSNHLYLHNILDSADQIVNLLPAVGSRLTIERFTNLFDSLKDAVDGMSVSTISKILTFWKVKAASSESVIVDQFVLECIHLFDDFWGMSTNASSADAYYSMIKKINGLARKMSVTPEQTELFLFRTGKLVKKNRHQLFNLLLAAYSGFDGMEDDTE